MKYSLRQKYLFQARINRYQLASGGNKDRAKRLYNANIRLAQAFHPILTQFEVVLRNSLNHQLSAYFTVNEWKINLKSGFMSSRSLRTSRYFLRRSVQKTEDNLNIRGIAITSGKIIQIKLLDFGLHYTSHIIICSLVENLLRYLPISRLLRIEQVSIQNLMILENLGIE